jgi:hydroxybutyrate-dimer hydrolase
MNQHRIRPGAAIALAAGLLVACGGGKHDKLDERPVYLSPFIAATSYDGIGDDLLTGGLGKTGLAAAAAPGFADPLHPTPAELRRNAIYNNYRALQDINPNSGFGTLYGPNVDAAGHPTTAEGKIAGTEYITYAEDGRGARNVTLMVQIPDNFDPGQPCIVTGTSSGSRGIYGAIGTSGEWGLKHRCAVAYSDKGGGIGLYTFDDDGVNLQNGVRAPRVLAGPNAIFAPELSLADRLAFGGAYPDRVAFKHAHSQLNPEKDWGKTTLQAVEFAYYLLNQKYAASGHGPSRFDPSNTIVIASSISDGGGAALLAAEQDTRGLISGVAVTEPQIQPRSASGYSVLQGGRPVSAQGKSLFDYATYAALYQPCIAGSAGRCASLAAKGLLNGFDLSTWQADAYARLHAYGWLPDADILQAAHASINVLMAVTYANAYGRFSVTDKLCGFTFASADAFGHPIPFTPAERAQSFATMDGVPGNAVYEESRGGGRAYTFGISHSSGVADQSLDGFLCLRGLATGLDPLTGLPLGGQQAAQSLRVRNGVDEVLASGDLHGKPALMVQGRADALVPLNHASRAYLGLNAAVEGGRSQLRYVEVTHANHFDAFTGALPTAIVPLHVYLFRALDAMYAHLRSGTPLPPSQVVHTVPRSSANEPMTVGNVPPIAPAPPAAERIVVSGATVDIPN